MSASVLTFVLVAVFGSTSWLGTNSVWMELPLLTAGLPEGWSLPSYLAIIVQIACIGPLFYGLIHKCCCEIRPGGLIVASLVFAIVCHFSLAFLWELTIGGYSVALYAFVFGLALVNSTSNVLFLPYMGQYHSTYLTAYFVGMGLSALLPSLLSLAQGSGDYDCVKTAGSKTPTAVYKPARFEVRDFQVIVAIWTIFATICFIFLNRRDHGRYEEKAAKSGDDPHEGSPLNAASSSSATKEVDSTRSPRRSSKSETSVEGSKYVIILLLTAFVNSQMNGIVPSVHSYAALPYSRLTYHLGLTLSNVVSPLASLAPLFWSPRRLSTLIALSAAATSATGFIIYLAASSPDPLLVGSTWGSVISISASTVSAALHSFLRTVFASLLQEGNQGSQSRLFWCGVFIQIGSFIGSAIMFPLVNFVHVFQSAPACR